MPASVGESMAAARFASIMLGLGLSLAAPPMAHAIVELDAVVRPSLAASQRAWMNCALNTAEELLATAPALNSPAIADRAIASCRKGEDLMEEAMFDDGSIFRDYNAVTRMAARLREALIEYLDHSRSAASAVNP